MNQQVNRGNGYETTLGALTETGRHGGGGGGGRGGGRHGGRGRGGHRIRWGGGYPAYGWGNYGWNPGYQANQYALWWNRQIAQLQNLRAYLVQQAAQITDVNLIAQLQQELDQLAQQVAILQGQVAGQPAPAPPMPATSGWGGGGPCTGGCRGGGFSG